MELVAEHESIEQQVSEMESHEGIFWLSRLSVATCMVVSLMKGAEAGQSAKQWAEWRQEGNAMVAVETTAAAVQAFRQALTLGQAANVNDHTIVGLYQALAWAYSREGEFAEAECEYRRAMALVERDEGTSRPGLRLARSPAFRSCPLARWARRKRYETLREAISMNEQKWCAGRSAVVRDGLAKILCREKRWDEADKLLLESKAYYASHASEDPEVIAELLNDLGVLRFDQGRYVEAGELHNQSIHILETICGNDHPTLIVPLNNLATIYIRTGRYEDAERDFQQALAICRKSLGEEHPIYGDVLGNYAALLRKLGRKREAKKAEEQAQRILQASNRRNGVGFKVNAGDLRSDGG